MFIIKRFILSLSIFALLSSCAVVNEGEIDYVRTIPDQYTSINNHVCSPARIAASKQVKMEQTRDCYNTLFRKYTQSNPITKGESIAVYLSQAFITGAPESRSFNEFIRGSSANAELVVLASVCEQGVEGCSQSFGGKAEDDMRVVFFTRGAKAVQYLNFSFMPVYGPITYNGGTLNIHIKIIELDAVSDKEKQMVKTLADLGASAFPPADKAMDILDTLGQTFLTANKDDVIFSYSLTLIPEGENSDVTSPLISEGNYAFIRKPTVKNYQEEEIWRDLYFDELTGRLVRKCSTGEDTSVTQKYTKFNESTGEIEETSPPKTFEFCKKSNNSNSDGISYKDYRDNTYLSFQIKKGLSPVKFDSVQKFSQLKADLNAEGAEDIDRIDSKLKEFTSNLKNASRVDALNTLLIKMKAKAKPEKNVNHDAFTVSAMQFVNKLNTEYTSLKNCSSAPCNDLLSELQITDFLTKFHSTISAIDYSQDTSTLVTLPADGSPSLTRDTDKLKIALKSTFIYSAQKQAFDIRYSHYKNLKSLEDEIIAIKNEITLLAGDKKQEKEKEQEKTNKEQSYKHAAINTFIQLQQDLTVFINIDCNNTGKSKTSCINLPSKDQFNELITLYRTHYSLNDNTVLPPDIDTLTKPTPTYTIQSIEAKITTHMGRIF